MDEKKKAVCKILGKIGGFGMKRFTYPEGGKSYNIGFSVKNEDTGFYEDTSVIRVSRDELFNLQRWINDELKVEG
jgi:hypothetical protein